MSSSEPGQAVLCYLCEVDLGTTDLQSTSIPMRMELISQRALDVSPDDLVCSKCADLFVRMDDLSKQLDSVKATAKNLMVAKVARMRKSRVSKVVLCYLCEVDLGTTDLQSTSIPMRMEFIRQRALNVSPDDLVCSKCADLFVRMDDLPKQLDSVEATAKNLMVAKVARMRQGLVSKVVPDKPRFNCMSCSYKTFELESFQTHSCPDEKNPLFSIDFLTESETHEQTFQKMLFEEVEEPKIIITVDGRLHEVVKILDPHGHEIVDQDQGTQTAIAAAKTNDAFLILEKPLSSDEEE